jgi:anaerobic selenocysteine-containing dehydrogenase
MAITGNIERYGGHMLSRVRSPKIDDGTLTFDLRLGLHQIRKELPVGKEFPALYEPFKRFTGLVNPLMKLLREGRIKALLIDAMNMPFRTPTYDKYLKAIKNIELIVVHDVYMSEAAKFADVVLPAKTFLERNCPSIMLWSKYGIIGVRQKVVEAPGECKSNIELFTALARKMGLEKYFSWKSEEELIDWILEPVGVKFEELKSKGYVKAGEPLSERIYEKEGFPTISNKVELYSSILEKIGVDPMPTWHDELLLKPNEKYPYILSSYTPVRQHSWSLWKAVTDLENILEQDHAYLSKKIATEKGIKNGDWILIETKHGVARYKAIVKEYMHPETVLVSRGNHEEAKIIDVLDPIDPVSSFIAERGIPCNVRRAD